jgi:hypothetical protein
MTDDERTLLVETARFTHQLSRDRNDMLVGITAAILDLYRADFRDGRDTKQDALARLQIQCRQLSGVPGEPGVVFLKYLMDTLEADKLDAAKLYREPTVGSA